MSRSHFFLTLSPSLNRILLFQRFENHRHPWVDAIHRSAGLTGRLTGVSIEMAMGWKEWFLALRVWKGRKLCSDVSKYIYVSKTIRAAYHPLTEYQECLYNCLRVFPFSVTTCVFVEEPGSVIVRHQQMHSTCCLKNGKSCSPGK